jgi:ATP-dependent Clp protease ATP-binding subunit ClpA
MAPPPSLQDLIETVRQDSPSDDLLDLLVTASATVSQLEEVNDALLGHFVDRCRRAGRSWSEISAALGVSKQAVHKRFSGQIADRLISRASPPTLERFTARARSVLVAADTSARALHRDHVGAEHLLLGLFAEPEGIAGRTLAAMSVSRDRVELAVRAQDQEPAADAAGSAGDAGSAGAAVSAGDAGSAGAGMNQLADAVKATLGPKGRDVADSAGATAEAAGPTGTAEGPAAAGQLRYSPEGAGVLRDALAEALELGHNYIGTEHILLGLLRDPDAPVAKLLDQLGVSPAEARVRVSEMLRGFGEGSASGA